MVASTSRRPAVGIFAGRVNHVRHGPTRPRSQDRSYIVERRPNAIENGLPGHRQEVAVGTDSEGELWPLGPQATDDAVEAQALLVVIVDRAEDGRVRPVEWISSTAVAVGR